MKKILTYWFFICLYLFLFPHCASKQPTDTQNILKSVHDKCSDNIWYLFSNLAYRECFKKNLKSDFDSSLLALKPNDLPGIEKAFLQVMDYYNAVLEYAKKDMEDSTSNRLKITILGIITTTAATALATASPANAAAVAGLGSISTGIITYQGVIAEEGGSRVALYRVYTKLQERQESLKQRFEKYLVLASMSPQTDSADFLENYTYLKLVIYESFIFAYKTPSMSSEEEIDKINKEIVRAKKELGLEIEKLQETNKKLAEEKKIDKQLENFKNAEIKINSILSNIK